ncbi:Pumilio-family RNA binding repeat protein [Aspergillus fijiensis CBS 313.89]|uniref:Pumilio-family RNA binding repeat protein n=1 Tax=Aspergillus fijiensis CBS 313.89 TaxID=1448319 RepID=A0A8G1S122_9EURO|nr:Pumilio-family RNA binding repeat protein [Aspergillus fijiensis CBS 313.89]RAK80466.1 Pumilio-family RNA binding repeat protein [Aspergillus fijiensis CBS 313.89]
MSLMSITSSKLNRTDSGPPHSVASTFHVLNLGDEVASHTHSKVPASVTESLRSSVPGGSQTSADDFYHDVPSSKKQKLEHFNIVSPNTHTEMERILARLSPKPQPSEAKLPVDQSLFSRIPSEQHLLKRHSHHMFDDETNPDFSDDHTDLDKSPSSLPSGEIPRTSTDLVETEPSQAVHIDMAEVLRLKQELLAANSTIALQEQELAQTRVIKHTIDQALGPPSEAEFNGREVTEQTIANLQSAFKASQTGFTSIQDGWNTQDDSQSDMSDALSAGAYNRNRAFWTSATQQAMSTNMSPIKERPYGEPFRLPCNSPYSEDSNRFWTGSSTNSCVPSHDVFQSHRVFSGPASGSFTLDSNIPEEQARYLQAPGPGPRRSFTQNSRGGPCFPSHGTPWPAAFASSPESTLSRSSIERSNGAYQQQVAMYPIHTYHQRPIGTPLSPTATEFNTSNSWQSSSVGTNPSQTYISPLEPINYRRLLDKNVSCDWKYIVDKIVCNNDQQASIFLQQKLKVGTTEQKYEIIEAIVHQAYPLMVNRFGNFLVQRCFEHGTPDQIIAIANAIKGNTLSLSMDPFGCHVIQKAFDCVPEEHKAVMVHELLRRIPETVIHRYACHVWQKLFELRWSGEPPQIMSKVNEALCGMWHEVALGETGSLVVQNIFENCVEDEKRPAIEEVLSKIDILAHGQFGNWCIQHVCEHGAPHDKSRAVEHILAWSVDYSMDQFASKIVEKCLKIGGSEFLDRYLARVCTGRSDRPRMPLIDIAGDQYGNYLIQWILINASPHQRELVASHIRKHMVSLRGSKFGSRVAMLCCNHSHTTRPGPGAGLSVNRFGNFGDDRYQMPGQHGGRFSRATQWNPNYPPFR